MSRKDKLIKAEKQHIKYIKLKADFQALHKKDKINDAKAANNASMQTRMQRFIMSHPQDFTKFKEDYMFKKYFGLL